jgi:hypothetical protein
MANVRSSITAHLQLNRAQFTTGLREASQQTRMFGKDLQGINAAGAGIGRSSGYASLAGKLAGAAAAAMAAKGAVTAVFDAASNRESLIRSLAATSDGARTVEEQFDRLQAAALRSGVGVDTMVQSFIQLRGASLSSSDAEKTASAVANALNIVGRGADFGPVMVNLKQISSRIAGIGDEIKETANYLPEITKLSQLKFGTSTAEGLNKKGITGKMFVAGITEELAKYETATGGAKMATANLDNAWENLKVTSGNVFLPAMVGSVDVVTSGIKKLGEGIGFVKDEYNKMTSGTDSTRNSSSVVAPDGILNEEQLQKKRTDAAAEAQLLEEARAAAVRKALDDEENLASLQQAVSIAKADTDAAAILAAETDLALAKEKLTIMRDLNATEAEATEHIKTRVKIEQEAANAARARAMEKTNKKEGQDLSLLEAEANGMSPRRQKKLQKDIRLQQETQRLKDEGFTPEQATGLANRKVTAEDRLTENKDRAARGLRPRSRTITDPAERSRRAFDRLSTGDKAKMENLSSSEDAYQTFQRKQKGGIGAYSGDDPLAQRSRPSRIQGAGRKPDKEPGSTSVKEGSTGSPNAGGPLLTGVNRALALLQSINTSIASMTPTASSRTQPN